MRSLGLAELQEHIANTPWNGLARLRKDKLCMVTKQETCQHLREANSYLGFHE